MSGSDITVLICTWNRAALLRETLLSVAKLRMPRTITWDVTVVDNNSTDGTRAVIEGLIACFPVPLRYVFEGQQGKSCAMNAGIDAAAAPIIAWTDDDVHPDPEWLWEACRPLIENPDVGYTGGPVRPIWERSPPSWFERSGRTLWGTLAILDYGDESFVFEERRRIPLGVNFAIRKSLIDRVGRFDASLGRSSGRLLLGQELPEFFSRAREAGAVGLYVPGMVLDHHVPARRLTPNYCRRWWYGKGVSRARMEAIHPITELGLDLRTVPTIAGVPRFLFGSAIKDAVLWLRAVAHRDTGARIAVETQLCYFAGQVRERVRLATARGRAASPRDPRGSSARPA
jgi:glycosyltransferase involved in cell wall biosynthesis